MLKPGSGREFTVANLRDVPGQGMITVEAGETKILLVRQDGELSALGAHCPHYGAPLKDGTLHEGCITCPWHRSAFDASSGDLVEPPSLDALPRFDCCVDDATGDVVVIVPEKAPSRRVPAMATAAPELDERTFVIIGGGGAGSAAAEMLRTQGFRGHIVMLTGDQADLPYDRPSCSKAYLRGESSDEKMPLRRSDFYKRYGIEQRSEKAAMIDVPNRSIQLTSGEIIEPDAMLLATGGTPNTLETGGVWLEGVYTLRTWDDSRRIREAAGSARTAVLIGASFIAMETAVALREHDVEVTVIAPESEPFADTFGPEIARFLRERHESQGVKFRLGKTARQFVGQERLQEIELDDGTRLEADVAILGIGIRPATKVIKGANLHEDGSIEVDQYLQVREGVFAAGDIARYPEPHLNEPVRIEHWRLAQQQGRVAAQNMLGHQQPFRKVPFFWTRHYDLSIGYAGHARSWDETILAGSIADEAFTVYFVRDDRLIAAAGTQINELTALSELMQEGALPEPRDLSTEDPNQLERVLLHAGSDVAAGAGRR